MENLRSFLAWTWTLHLLLALWLATGVFSSAVVQSQIKRTADAAERSFGFRLLWRLMTIFILPGVLLAGALGFYLVNGFQFGYGVGWIQASAALYFVLLAAIVLVQVPHFSRALGTKDAAELERLARAPLPLMLTHVNALLILVMTILMAMKPAP
jgi:uncharacterized membrane protein